MRVAAIDQGTTSTRVLVTDGASRRIAHAAEHRQLFPKQGWVEHDPEELIANVEACIEAAGKVDAIAIANQGESCLAWDAESKKPVSPVIVWQDQRTQPRIDALKARGAEAMTFDRAGLPLDPYFSASKFRWILDNVDEARRLAQVGRLRLGTTDAFFLDRLAGVYATDVTTASRTSLMNLGTGEWDAELCALFGVPMECLPPIRATVGAFGFARTSHGDVPIRASVVDQQASLYGHGCREPGDLKVTFGTGAFALSVTGDRPVIAVEQGLLPTVAWQFDGQPRVYALDGGVYNAGSAVNWARSIGLFESFEEIETFEGPAAIERGLVFVPALSGLACPYWDRRATGLWLGITLATSRLDLVRAILEGVALRTAQVLTAMDTHGGIGAEISIDGGLSRNRYFRRFLASLLGKVVVAPCEPELTALGAASLAMHESGGEIGAERPPLRVEPQTSHGEWLGLFTAAVERARNWPS